MSGSLVSHVKGGLEKVRAKEWAAPLGKALGTSGDILSFVGEFVPMAGIIGGALSFGATLLNPEPDLQKQLGEIKTDFGEIKTDMERMFKDVERSNQSLEDELTKMKGLMSQTFDIALAIRFKVSIIKRLS